MAFLWANIVVLLLNVSAPMGSKKQVCLGSWSLLQPQLSSRYVMVLDDLPSSRIQAVGAK